MVSYIDWQWGTQSPSLCLTTWDLFTWCIQRGISLQVIHLAGKENVITDALSEGRVVPTEWTLYQLVVKHIFNTLGAQHVSLLAWHMSPTAYKIASGCPQFQLDEDPCLRISTHFTSPPGGDKDRERAVEDNSRCSIWPRQPYMCSFQVSWAFSLTYLYQLCSSNDQISRLNPSFSLLHPDPDNLHLSACMRSNSPSCCPTLLTDLLEKATAQVAKSGRGSTKT